MCLALFLSPNTNVPKLLPLLLLATIAIGGCARVGLLADESPELYQGIARLSLEERTDNPSFLVVGDTQSGWRIHEKLLRSDRWKTKKSFAVPFFQLWNIGHGLVGGVNFLRHVPDYGGRERRKMRQALVAELDARPADFLLHLGDICLTDGRRVNDWKTYLRENRGQEPLLDLIPVVPVLGNHERSNDTGGHGRRNYRTVFQYPDFYVIDFRDVSIFVLDSNLLLDQKQDIADDRQDELFAEWFVSDDPSKPSWLQRELARRADKRFKIVACHHPLISFGKHYRDWSRRDYGRDLGAKRQRLIRLLMDYNVQVQLAGHEHFYERNLVTDQEGRSLQVVVSSGGGVPIRQRPGEEQVARWQHDLQTSGFSVTTQAFSQTHHFTRVSVVAGRLVVETVAIPDNGSPFTIETLKLESGH